MNYKQVALMCCSVVFLPQHSVVQADFFQHIASVRSLPSAILKDSIPVVSLSRRRKQRDTTTGTATVLSSIKAKLKQTGYYYGLPQEFVTSSSSHAGHHKRSAKQESLDSLMSDALAELRGMRQEMNALRRELKSMKRQLGHEVEDDELDHQGVQEQPLLARLRKQREWDKIGLEIEKWAEKLLFEEIGSSEDYGWKEIKCSKLCSQYNKGERTKCYMKWMKDSRGVHASKDHDEEYPCMKVYATLDAPMEKVCAYLADAKSLPEYNDLVVKHQDLEEISPHSKICWGQSPKILFVQPRNFVTFCHHRWLRDGTQVIVNQACNHEEYGHAIANASDATSKAFAIRGANFISPHPEDPNKTRFALVAHANPGNDVSPWMCRLAVNNLVPIEPFKLFHKINKNVLNYKGDPNQTQMVKTVPGRSNRPAGFAQMGYACFWPNGGGLKEGFIHPHHPDHVDPSIEMREDHDEEEVSEAVPDFIQVED
jgi:hypothetical protein